LGARAKIFGRIYAQTSAIENPAYICYRRRTTYGRTTTMPHARPLRSANKMKAARPGFDIIAFHAVHISLFSL